MKQFTVYESETGKIIKVLTQSREPVLKDGQGFVEGNYPDDLFDIINGHPVESVKDTARVPPAEEKEIKDQQTPEGSVRFERDTLLQKSDWTQMPDSPLDAAQRALWAAYRQSLRDVTAQDGFPLNIIWPTPPNS